LRQHRRSTHSIFGIGTGWLDVIVAAIMAALALQGAAIVIRQPFRVASQARHRYPWSDLMTTVTRLRSELTGRQYALIERPSYLSVL
jgi:hypothetical protein